VDPKLLFYQKTKDTGETQATLLVWIKPVTNHARLGRNRGMVDALVKLYRFEGIRGLYKGFLPGVFGVSHGALQFMAYEEMKNSFNNYRKMPIDTKLVPQSKEFD